MSKGNFTITPVILSGGSGTRLWPLSRRDRPKQYLPLIHPQQTMLQATLQRLEGVEHLAPPLILCNAEHRFLVAQQLQEIGAEEAVVMLEESGKSTAPAVAAAAHYLRQQRQYAQKQLMLVLSADHEIVDLTSFHRAIMVACEAALQGQLVTFGITPTSPHTGYGYIRSAALSAADEVRQVERFVEKPDRERARHFLQQGNYYWNSGMFVFECDQLLEELARLAPEIAVAASAVVEQSRQDYDFIRLAPYAEALMPLSIDHAVMERTDRAVMVPLSAGWSDVGSWSSLWEIGNKDEEGNSLQGEGHLRSTRDCLVHASSRVVVTIGIENQVIVDTPDVLLVASKDQIEEVRAVVASLEQAGSTLVTTHAQVFRPWGWYNIVDQEDGFKVKRICVNPGASLSLQRHLHRSEHWIVVRGVATVTCGEQVGRFYPNQSTYIPIGELHRLENREETPLHMVEVQSGSYLEEDDIERFEDEYGR